MNKHLHSEQALTQDGKPIPYQTMLIEYLRSARVWTVYEAIKPAPGFKEDAQRAANRKFSHKPM